MTTSASTLDERLSQAIGDWIEEAVTTNITTNKFLISTELAKYTSSDDFFNDFWAYITDIGNATKDRKVFNYDAGATRLAVLGDDFASDTEAATFRLYRYSYTEKLRAINKALEEIYPNLHKALEDRTLITGNILPNPSFEDWTLTTVPDFYTLSSATATEHTTAGQIRGRLGSSAVKVTDSGTGVGYLYITSDDYPRLLDLMGRTVDFKCWANPETTDDAGAIEIYTIKETSTGVIEQTLTSSTTCPNGRWTLLELEDQSINDDIVEIQLRFKTTAASEYVIFDGARIQGLNLYEYLLPKDFREGKVIQVHVQTNGYSSDICDDIRPRTWERVYGSEIINDGTYKYLRLPDLYSINRQIRLLGDRPLESLTSYSGTISIDDGKQLDLLIAYAAYKLFQANEQPPSPEDSRRYQANSARWLMEYYRLLPSAKMIRSSGGLKIRTY